MPSFDIENFLARSTDKLFNETTLSKVLEVLPKTSIEGPWLAGGSVRKTLLGHEPDTDFDFFFKNEAQLATFREELKSAGFTEQRETKHNIDFKGVVGTLPIKVQLIRFKFYESAEEVIQSFDFTICQFLVYQNKLIVGNYSLWDLARKRLAVNVITFPLSTMRRVIKYTTQGFTACAGCLTQILTATTENPALAEQLHIEYVD